MKRIVVFLCVALLVITACTKKETENVIVFGVQGPETGDIAVYGLQTLYGAQVAAEEINAAGGINGTKIKLVHYDSRGDKAEAVTVAQRLINNDKVCAILGEPTTGALSAIRNIGNQSQTIMLSAGSTALGVTDGLPFIFRNTLLDADGAPATIKFLKENKGWTRYALITSVNNDYSVGLSDTFRQAIKDNGVTLVGEQSINDKDTNISAQITAMKNMKFDAVIFTGYYQEASLILLEMRKQGINVPLVGGDGFQSPELYNVAKDAALGTVFFAGFSASADTEIIRNFNEKMISRNYQPDMFAAQGYDAIYLFAKAAADGKVANCADPSQRVNMRDALAVIKNYIGVSGEMSFDEQGNAVKNPFIQEVAKDASGNYYVELINK